MGAEKGHEDRVVPLILQGRGVLRGGSTPRSPLLQEPVSSPLCTPPHKQVALTAALRGPGSGVPFSSSSWMDVARMGTLWEDM